MQVDPDGFVLVCAVCGLIGFAVGWCGGFMDAVQRRREFDAKQRAPGVTVPGHQTFSQETPTGREEPKC